jgi:trimeric autotransporter adhesin
MMIINARKPQCTARALGNYPATSRHPHSAFLTALVTLALVASWERTCHAQGTAFSYHGRLDVNGTPVEGTYDLTFALFSSSSGGTAVGSSLTNSSLSITGGLVEATLDFGPVFDGTRYWLEIGVRTNGGSVFTVLSPRQELKPGPYAIFAEGANATGLSGTIPASTLTGAYPNPITLNNPANIFSGNGGGLYNISASLLGGLAASNFWQTLGNAGTSPTNGNFVGTTDFQALELRVNSQRALRLEPAPSDAAHSKMVQVIGGSELNFVATGAVVPGGFGATISGGGGIYQGLARSNAVYSDFATIGGGASNTCRGPFSTVSGGEGNLVAGDHATVAGGLRNQATGRYATALGSFSVASGENSMAVGGRASGAYAIALGPAQATGNSAVAAGSSLAVGLSSVALGIATANGDYSVALGNGTSAGIYSTAAGTAEADGLASFAAGWGNIAGGDYSSALGAYSQASGAFATVTGSNSIAGGDYATVGGGANDGAEANFATVGGGWQNTAAGTNSFIGGGYGNEALGWSDTVGGGQRNQAMGGAAGCYLCGGGVGGVITGAATVGGGFANQAIGFAPTVGGGAGNIASGYASTVCGGDENQATNSDSTACGGRLNLAGGVASFAAGWVAQALNNGSFVWADWEGGGLTPFSSTRDDQFAIRAAGGVLINVPSSSGLHPAALEVDSSSGDGVVAYFSQNSSDAAVVIANGGSGDLLKAFNADFNGNPVFEVANNGNVYSRGVQISSDRNLKENFRPVEPRQVLEKIAALPISQWNYKVEPQNVRHVGPMAQDFHASFGLDGDQDKHISIVDEGGVALAGIQGLNQKLESACQDSEQRILKLEAENADLKSRLEKLELVLSRQK